MHNTQTQYQHDVWINEKFYKTVISGFDTGEVKERFIRAFYNNQLPSRFDNINPFKNIHVDRNETPFNRDQAIVDLFKF